METGTISRDKCSEKLEVETYSRNASYSDVDFHLTIKLSKPPEVFNN